MGISDLCLGAIAFPMAVFLHTKRNVFKSCALDKATSYVTLFLAFFSFLLLYCISIDRYFKVMKMNRYNLYMNDFRMKIMVIASFIVATIISSTSIMFTSFAQQIVTVIVGSFLVIFAIAVYIFLLRRLRSHTMKFNRSNRIRPSRQVPTNNEASTRVSTTEGKSGAVLNMDTGNGSNQLSATKTIQFLLISLTISYAPYHIVSGWWAYEKFFKEKEPGVNLTLCYAWGVFIALFNASANSWIIILGNARSRKFVSSLFPQKNISSNSQD